MRIAAKCGNRCPGSGGRERINYPTIEDHRVPNIGTGERRARHIEHIARDRGSAGGLPIGLCAKCQHAQDCYGRVGAGHLMTRRKIAAGDGAAWQRICPAYGRAGRCIVGNLPRRSRVYRAVDAARSRAACRSCIRDIAGVVNLQAAEAAARC